MTCSRWSQWTPTADRCTPTRPRRPRHPSRRRHGSSCPRRPLPRPPRGRETTSFHPRQSTSAGTPQISSILPLSDPHGDWYSPCYVRPVQENRREAPHRRTRLHHARIQERNAMTVRQLKRMGLAGIRTLGYGMVVALAGSSLAAIVKTVVKTNDDYRIDMMCEDLPASAPSLLPATACVPDCSLGPRTSWRPGYASCRPSPPMRNPVRGC